MYNVVGQLCIEMVINTDAVDVYPSSIFVRTSLRMSDIGVGILWDV